MPICRSHKRLLKTTRILKKENHNKEEKSFKGGGTGNGYMRNNMNFLNHLSKLELEEQKKQEEEYEVPESNLHDRTKWKSSKNKSINRKNAINNKTELLYYSRA